MKPTLSLRTFVFAAIALALLAGIATRPGAAQTPRIDLDVKRAVVRIVPERCFSASTCRAQLDQPGSGVVIHPSGLILTAWHVTSRDNDFEQENHWDDFVIEVIGEDDGLPPMVAYRARIVATRPEMDLALLRIDRDAEGEPLTPNALASLAWLPVYTDSSSRLEAGLTGLPVLGFPTPRLGGRASLFTNQRFTLDSQNRSDAELWVQWPLDRGYSGGPGLVWMDEHWQVAGIVLSQLGSGASNRTMLRDLSLAFRGLSWRPGEQEISANDIRLTRAVDDGQTYLKVDATIHSQGWEGTPLEFQLLFFEAGSRQPWRPAGIDLPTLPSGQVYWAESLRPERPVEDSLLTFRVPLMDDVPPLDELVFQLKLAESGSGIQRWSSNRWHKAMASEPMSTAPAFSSVMPTLSLTPNSTSTPEQLIAIEAAVRATLTSSAPTAQPTDTPTRSLPTFTHTSTLDARDLIAIAVNETLTALAPTPTRTATPTDTPTATPTTNAAATFQAAVNATLTALSTPTRLVQTPTLRLLTSTPTFTLTLTPSAGEEREIGGIEFVYVPAGEFMMGSSDDQIASILDWCKQFNSQCNTSWFSDEQPAHFVYVDGFWIMRTEVTNGQWQRFMVAQGYDSRDFWTDEGWVWKTDNRIRQPSLWSNSVFNGKDLPVVGISWHEAVAFSAWLSAEVGFSLRLPTEAEWEKAARGLDGWIFPWGDVWDGSKANYCDTSCTEPWKDDNFNDGQTFTSPVATFLAGASPFGSLDMAGNVWEWVLDWYDDSYVGYPRHNPTGPLRGTLRVLRGGSWHNDPLSLRVSIRHGKSPTTRPADAATDNVGFRLVAPDYETIFPFTADAFVNTRALNMRAGPSTTYEVLGTYPEGTLLVVIGRDQSSSWLKVHVPDGSEGWMAASLIQLNIPLTQVPVTAAPSTSTPTVTNTAQPTPTPTRRTSSSGSPLPTPRP